MDVSFHENLSATSDVQYKRFTINTPLTVIIALLI